MKPNVHVSGGNKIGQKVRELRNRLTRRNGVLVGVPEGKGSYEDGTKIAVIAAVHEYGSADGRIPERSFLRGPLRAEQKTFAAIIRNQTPLVIRDELTMSQVLNSVGARAAGVSQEAISAGIAPANAPSTIARKGSSTPLIDTRNLAQSITHVLEDEGDQ